MDSLKFGRDDSGRWHVTQAPHQVEFTLSEVCGANTAIVHVEGRRLVWCDEVWYLPTSFDADRGVLFCVLERDDR